MPPQSKCELRACLSHPQTSLEETETEKSHRGREGRKKNDIENTDPGGRWETKTQKEAVRKDPKKRRNEKE